MDCNYFFVNNYEYIFINKPYDLPPYWIKVYLVNDLFILRDNYYPVH